MRRREFITLLGGAAVAWPVMARAQQATVYTLGVLTLPNPEPLLKALREGLRDAGYVEGGNLRLEIGGAIHQSQPTQEADGKPSKAAK